MAGTGEHGFCVRAVAAQIAREPHHAFDVRPDAIFHSFVLEPA
jgi:hypothetical protein